MKKPWKATVALFIFLSLLSRGGSAIGGTASPGWATPPECPKGLVCFTVEEWAKIDRFRAQLLESKNLCEEKLRHEKGKIISRGISAGALMVDGETIPYAQYDITIWKFYAAAGLYDGHAGVNAGIRFPF